MNRYPHTALCAVLPVLLLFILLIPVVSAATPPATATVPPILQACAHATYPEARFICSFPGGGSAVIPDGPPYIIECTDNSSVGFNQSIVEWKWEFGDGETSVDQNPRHTYAEAGKYDIGLTVTTFCGRQYTNSTINSTYTFCSVPEPAFSTNVTEGYAPLAVEVTDASLNTPLGITTWTYWFDNTHFSHKRNPVFVYTDPGTYTINQTIWKDCVQLGSAYRPPATRQIIVSPPPAVSIDSNDTSPPPAPVLTGAVPVATTPVMIPEVTAAVTAADTLPPATPGTGALSVTTEPPGAELYVDEILRGSTPITVPDLSAGTHNLRFAREGYQNMTMPVTISGGQTTTFSTSLLSAGSTGIAILPVIALLLIILGTLGGGIYLFLRHRAQNQD